jgi:hypothetical protein
METPVVQNPRAKIEPVTDLKVALDTEDSLDLETEEGEDLVVV